MASLAPVLAIWSFFAVHGAWAQTQTAAKVLTPGATAQAALSLAPAATTQAALSPAPAAPAQAASTQTAPSPAPAVPAPAAPLPTLDDALQRLKAADPAARRQAAEDIGRIRSADGTQPLCDALAVDASTDVRRQAAESLAYANGPDIGDVLIKALKDPAAQVRVAAARTLGAPVSAESIPSLGSVYALKEAYSDEDLDVRREAIKSLSQVAAAATADIATEQTMGQLVQDNASDVLRKALSDADAQVRLQAAIALGRLGQWTGESVAIPLLKDSDPVIRTQAAQCLGLVGSKEKSLPALADALSKETAPAVSQALSDAVAQLKARLGTGDAPVPPEPSRRKN